MSVFLFYGDQTPAMQIGVHTCGTCTCSACASSSSFSHMVLYRIWKAVFTKYASLSSVLAEFSLHFHICLCSVQGSKFVPILRLLWEILRAICLNFILYCHWALFIANYILRLLNLGQIIEANPFSYGWLFEIMGPEANVASQRRLLAAKVLPGFAGWWTGINISRGAVFILYYLLPGGSSFCGVAGCQACHVVGTVGLLGFYRCKSLPLLVRRQLLSADSIWHSRM